MQVENVEKSGPLHFKRHGGNSGLSARCRARPAFDSLCCKNGPYPRPEAIALLKSFAVSAAINTTDDMARQNISSANVRASVLNMG